MTFPQRVVNSFAALALSKVRDLFVYEKLEAVIDQEFPDEPRSSRPSLDELEHNAGLALQVKNLATYLCRERDTEQCSYKGYNLFLFIKNIIF